MAFKDLDEFFDDALSLPIGGKTYRIAPVNWQLGLTCQQLWEAGVVAASGGTPAIPTQLDDIAERDLFQQLLGPTFEEMREDGVSWPRMKHVGMTVFIWTCQTRQAAEEYWERAAGEAPALAVPNRAARRSTRTAGATATPARASTSGTRSRATSSSNSPARRTDSRGTTSSKRGAS